MGGYSIDAKRSIPRQDCVTSLLFYFEYRGVIQEWMEWQMGRNLFTVLFIPCSCEQRFLSAVRVEVVRVACLSRSWFVYAV